MSLYVSNISSWVNTLSSNGVLISTMFALAFIIHLILRTIIPLQKLRNQKSKVNVLRFHSEEAVAIALAKYIADLSVKSINENGSFSVVLSGGTLIDTLRSNVYAINDKLSPEDAADDYENRLKQLVNKSKLKKSRNNEFANFDLMLLGMGPDGHVASLFCWHFQRFEKARWVTFIKDSPKPPSQRITFTFPLINESSEIAMVVTGEDAADAVKIALSKTTNCNCFPLPVEKVTPVGTLTWFLDKEAAASGLSR